MSPLMERALTALFTDPQTDDLMTEAQARRMGIWIGLTVGGFFLAVTFAMGAFR